MRFRATYWPGTAQMHSDEVFRMTQRQLDSIARRWEFDATDRNEALCKSGATLSGTSDGCLLEEGRTCSRCNRTFYVKAHTLSYIRTCDECQKAAGVTYR